MFLHPDKAGRDAAELVYSFRSIFLPVFMCRHVIKQREGLNGSEF